MLSNIKYFFKKHCQNESNNDSQNPENRIDSSKYSTSDESISEFDKKRKKAKVKKSVGRPEDPVNKEYIKLGVRDKHGHKLRSYITSHKFWANVEYLHKVLELAKIAVKTVEVSKLSLLM
ncbi:12935_t:CDS:2 [Gigaspora rosea]|nr:12935_t:CDS:2 [Gigaspora rosea]